MGVLGREVWGRPGMPQALRNILKRCQTNVCECLLEYLERQTNGSDGMSTTWGNMTNEYAGRSGLDGHWIKFTDSRRGAEYAKEMWDENGCGNRGFALPANYEEMIAKEGTEQAEAEYEEKFGRPMPEYPPTADRSTPPNPEYPLPSESLGLPGLPPGYWCKRVLTPLLPPWSPISKTREDITCI